MAIAKFHSLKGAKKQFALVFVRPNPLVIQADCAYVHVDGVAHFADKPIGEVKAGSTFEIPDGYVLADVVNYETGEQLFTKEDHLPIKQLTYPTS